MPMGEYSDFADCVSKNKSKDDPSAYCGYIKHQIEGGKKKEEAMESPEHEAYHLEEEIKREEGGFMDKFARVQQRLGGEPERGGVCPNCGFRSHSEFDMQNHFASNPSHWPGKSEEEIPMLEEAMAFLDTLSATIDEVTLMAKGTGYHDVSEKSSPTPPTYMYEVKQQMADVVVKQAKGFEVQVNYFNTALDELRDIVKSANKFFIESGWNNKDTVKEYEAHKKKWGNDWI